MTPTATDTLVISVAVCLLLMTATVVLAMAQLLFHMDRMRKQEAEYREKLVDKIQNFAERTMEKTIGELSVLADHSRERQQAAKPEQTQHTPIDTTMDGMDETEGRQPDLYAMPRQ